MIRRPRTLTVGAILFLCSKLVLVLKTHRGFVVGRKKFSQGFSQAVAPGEGNTVIFVANSGQKMASNGITVDLDSLQARLEGGALVPVKDSAGLTLSLPMLIDHGASVNDICGSIVELEVTDSGLVATGHLANTEAGSLVKQLLFDGTLHNNFSIGVAFDEDDFQYSTRTIYNGELLEISVVYSGADERTRVLKHFQKEEEQEMGATIGMGSMKLARQNMIAKANHPAGKELALKNTTGGGSIPASFGGDQAGWLGSNEAVKEYVTARSLNRESPGSFYKRWADTVKTKTSFSSAIADADDLAPFIPQPIVTEIIDAYNTADPVWALVNKTGQRSLRVLEQNVDLFLDTGRAHGHTRGAQKQDEAAVFASRDIYAHIIYKRLQLERIDLLETGGESGLVYQYFMRELANRVFMTLGYSIIFDDFTDIFDSTNNRGMLSIEAMANDSSGGWPGEEFALTYEPDSGEPLFDQFRLAASEVKAPGAKVLVTNDKTVAELGLSRDANGAFLFGTAVGRDTLASLIGVDQIITPVWWGDEQDKVMAGCVFVPSQYKVVGDTTLAGFADFSLDTNTYTYLNEVYVGGALAYPQSACVVPAVSASGS